MKIPIQFSQNGVLRLGMERLRLPVEEMAAACIRLVMDGILDPRSKPKSLVFETPFIFSKSYGDFGHEL